MKENARVRKQDDTPRSHLILRPNSDFFPNFLLPSRIDRRVYGQSRGGWQQGGYIIVFSQQVL